MEIKGVQAIIFNKKTKKVLVIRKRDKFSKNIYWRLVKGTIEKGEKKKETLRREVEEEVGLKDIEIVKEINDYTFTDPCGVKRYVTAFLVFVEGYEKTIPSKEEGITGLKWVEPKEAIDMLKYEEEKNSLKKALKHIPLFK